MKQKRSFFSSFFLFWLCVGFLVPLNAAQLSTHELKTKLATIEQHAILYGDGAIDIYVFLDPKCPYSREFMGTLYDNVTMRSTYRYHIFCYELPRLKSRNLIATIYESSSPLQSLLEVMVGKKEMTELSTLTPSALQKLQAIELVAVAMGVKKRPYLFIVKDWN